MCPLLSINVVTIASRGPVAPSVTDVLSGFDLDVCGYGYEVGPIYSLRVRPLLSVSLRDRPPFLSSPPPKAAAATPPGMAHARALQNTPLRGSKCSYPVQPNCERRRTSTSPLASRVRLSACPPGSIIQKTHALASCGASSGSSPGTRSGTSDASGLRPQLCRCPIRRLHQLRPPPSESKSTKSFAIVTRRTRIRRACVRRMFMMHDVPGVVREAVAGSEARATPVLEVGRATVPRGAGEAERARAHDPTAWGERCSMSRRRCVRA